MDANIVWQWPIILIVMTAEWVWDNWDVFMRIFIALYVMWFLGKITTALDIYIAKNKVGETS